MTKIAAYELRNRYPEGVIPEGVTIYYQSEPSSRKKRVLGWKDAPIGTLNVNFVPTFVVT
jgi:hypothetical protein